MPQGTKGLQKSRLQVVFCSFWPWCFIFSLQHISRGWQLFGLLLMLNAVFKNGCTMSKPKYIINMAAVTFIQNKGT
jgi:hypothetical protein